MSHHDEIFRRLYENYSDAVVGYLVRDFGFRREDACDLAQDVFFRVYRSMETWQGSEWMYLKTAARRTALNEIRSRRTLMRGAPTVELDGDTGNEPVSETLPVLEELVSQETEAAQAEQLRQAIAALSSRLRAPLMLRLQGESYKEIARLLHLNLNVVKTRLHEAKIELRRTIGTAPEGGDDNDDA